MYDGVHYFFSGHNSNPGLTCGFPPAVFMTKLSLFYDPEPVWPKLSSIQIGGAAATVGNQTRPNWALFAETHSRVPGAAPWRKFSGPMVTIRDLGCIVDLFGDTLVSLEPKMVRPMSRAEAAEQIRLIGSYCQRSLRKLDLSHSAPCATADLVRENVTKLSQLEFLAIVEPDSQRMSK